VKKIPQGLWRDTEVGGRFESRAARVLYYNSRQKAYRIEYVRTAEPWHVDLRRWVPARDFGEGRRFQSMGIWGLLLRQKLDLRQGRPLPSAADFSFSP
jgi:hypothetical protein